MRRPTAIRLSPSAATVLIAVLGLASRSHADVFGQVSLTNHTVARYSNTGQYLGTVPVTSGELLHGLRATADGRLYAATDSPPDAAGTFTAMDPPYGSGTTTVLPAPGLTIPTDVTLDAAGRAYVASNAAPTAGQTGVFRYDPSTHSTTFIPVRPGGLIFDIAVAPDGDLFVTRSQTRVERYDATGTFLNEFTPGVPTALFLDIEVGPDGNLYAPVASDIRRYGPAGASDVFIPGGAGSGADIEFAPDGLLYVNNAARKSVLRFDAVTGAFRDVFITPDQYLINGQPGLASITVAVPEPAAFCMLVPLGLTALRRRRCMYGPRRCRTGTRGTGRRIPGTND